MRRIVVTMAALLLLATWWGGVAQADPVIWGINAAFSDPHINAVDGLTGAVLADFVAPSPDAASGNGRGIAVVGNTIYYSFAGSGKVYVTNSVTHADGGVLFDTGLGGIATIAWDGAHLWISAYDGTDNAYEYDLLGNKLATVPGFGNFRDGFEVANSSIIANRGDGEGPYDKYTLGGSLLVSAFLNTDAVPGLTGITTGVTFDGTDYYVSNPDSYSGGTERLLVFDSTGSYLRTVPLPNPGPQPGVGWLLEDLSSLGNVPTNTGGVPEPSTLLFLGTGLMGLGGVAWRRMGKR